MTATLDDIPSVTKLWLGDDSRVVSYGTPREIDLELLDLPTDGSEEKEKVQARRLMSWLLSYDSDTVLVFTNSRNRAHSIAAQLHSELTTKKWPVHRHFGPLVASQRERVEERMRSERYGICVATSTLEIGIDIGDIDTIVLADIPGSVSGFLQRIGRGNRRTGTCRVIGFKSSEEEGQLFHALLDCARRGDLDDIHEYDRPSVNFQQVLGLTWKATRDDHALTMSKIAAIAGTDEHESVIWDMVDVGTLIDIRGALVPCDRLMDEGDAGRIHSVISGGKGGAVIDIKTGESALHDADENSAGGALFHA